MQIIGLADIGSNPQAHRQRRLTIAKEYCSWTTREWKMLLFPDETKVHIVNSDDKRYVRRPVNHGCNNKYTRNTVKRGGETIKIRECFFGREVGSVKKNEGVMNQFKFKNTLKDATLLPTQPIIACDIDLSTR